MSTQIARACGVPQSYSCFLVLFKVDSRFECDLEIPWGDDLDGATSLAEPNISYFTNFTSRTQNVGL